MKKSAKKKGDDSLIRNRKAFYDFHIVEHYEAGIELLGTEVKSCRARNISIADAFARVVNGEVFMYNVHIATYEEGNRFNHDPKRPKRLLLHKREIVKLKQQTQEKGLTLVPLRLYLKHGRVKVDLGLAKGKTTVDKRDSLRAKEDAMEAKRMMARVR